MQHVHGVYICIMHILLYYIFAKLCNVYLFISYARRRRFVIFFSPTYIESLTSDIVLPTEIYCTQRPAAVSRGYTDHAATRDYYYFYKILNVGTNF